MRTAWAAKSRMELLSANIAAEGILRQWPDAALPADGVLGLEVRGALTPWAILDTDGEVRDDDREMWDELDIGADVTGVISNLSTAAATVGAQDVLNARDPFAVQQAVPRPQDGGGDHGGAEREQISSTTSLRDVLPASGGGGERPPSAHTDPAHRGGRSASRDPLRRCNPAAASRRPPCQRRLLAAQ